MKKVLWLVAARSGSKSIPNKNIKLLGGQPLLNYRVKCGLLTTYPSDVWISTDSFTYAQIAKESGAFVPFLRPEILSGDEVKSADVILHAMGHAKSISAEYEYIGLLEPTSPFILPNDLDFAISRLDLNKNAEAIVAVRESRPHKLFIQEEEMYLEKIANNLEKLNRFDRQAFKKEITPSGGFYISRWDSFIKLKTFYSPRTMGYEVDDISGIEIDEPFDWEFAEFIIEKQLFNKSILFENDRL
jgi:CMP-N,N'-diacetyllegionaminic acid synthase